jgi:hypothetical protein
MDKNEKCLKEIKEKMDCLPHQECRFEGTSDSFKFGYVSGYEAGYRAGVTIAALIIDELLSHSLDDKVNEIHWGDCLPEAVRKKIGVK